MINEHYAESVVTIFGIGGFIGSDINNVLTSNHLQVERGDWTIQDFKHKDLGTVIVCCGIGDCKKTDEMVSSHLDILRSIINTAKYQKLIFISSTRIYRGGEQSHEETVLKIDQSDSRALFNQLKILCETLVQAQSKPWLILRPSNVYGKAFKSKLFLPSLVRDAVVNQEINMYVSPDYSKDYVFVEDVSKAVYVAIKKSIIGIFNVASGENTSASEIAEIIRSRTDCKVNWLPNDVEDIFPVTSIDRFVSSFGIKARNVNELLSEMIKDFTHEFSRK